MSNSFEKSGKKVLFWTSAILFAGAISLHVNAHTQEEADKASTIELITSFVERCKDDQSVQATIVHDDGKVEQYMLYCEVVGERFLTLPEEAE